MSEDLFYDLLDEWGGLGVKVMLMREKVNPRPRPQITNSQMVAEMVGPILRRMDREMLVALYLDGKNHVLGINTVHVGTLTSCTVHPREVFKPAILLGAAGLILAHNHPSGDVTPSQEDHNIARQIKEAAKILGFQLLDNLIIGEGYLSFADEGLL